MHKLKFPSATAMEKRVANTMNIGLKFSILASNADGHNYNLGLRQIWNNTLHGFCYNNEVLAHFSPCKHNFLTFPAITWKTLCQQMSPLNLLQELDVTFYWSDIFNLLANLTSPDDISGSVCPLVKIICYNICILTTFLQMACKLFLSAFGRSPSII